MEQEQKQMWNLIDEIDIAKTRMGMWYSNLLLIAQAVEKDAVVIKYLSTYANALHLTLQGISECQTRIQTIADQAFQLTAKEPSKSAQPDNPPPQNAA